MGGVGSGGHAGKNYEQRAEMMDRSINHKNGESDRATARVEATRGGGRQEGQTDKTKGNKVGSNTSEEAVVFFPVRSGLDGTN